MKISVCYIIKNEGQFLKLSLDSVKSLAYDIWVIDTGSSDSSLEIAKEYTPHILHWQWADDFAAARNFAASKALGDWILFIDGDEVLEECAGKKLRTFLDNPQLCALGLLQRNYTSDRSLPHWKSFSQAVGEVHPLGRECEGYTDNLMYKLYRNHRGIEWRGVVHETIIPSCDELGLAYEESDILLHHFRELKGERFAQEKRMYYLQLAYEKLKRDPDHQNPWFELGIALSNARKFSEAELAFQEALKRRSDWAEARLYRARLLLFLERYEEAEEELRWLLKTAPDLRAEVLGHLSTAVLYQGRLEECDQLIQQAIREGVSNLSIHVNAGTLYFEQKKFGDALNHFRAASTLNPHDEFLKEAVTKTEAAIVGSQQA